MQDIRFDDVAQGYIIVPLRGGQRNTTHGVTILVNNALFPYFLEQHLAPADKDVIDYVAPRFAVGFTPFTDCLSARKKGFGFNQGIRLGRVANSDGASHTQIRVLFQHARTLPGWGWPGYSFVLNMNWLLRSLQGIEYPKWTNEGIPQLFAIHTGFSGGLVDTAFPITVTVGKTCARLLSDVTPKSFAGAADAMADTLDWFWGPQRHNLMQVRAGRNGALHVHQEPHSLVINPDEVQPGSGYKMYSSDTDDPVGQIVLLIGLAGVWEKLNSNK